MRCCCWPRVTTEGTAVWQVPIWNLVWRRHTNPMTFRHLILREIIKIVATRCQILRLKCTKNRFRPRWGIFQCSPRFPIWNKGDLLLRRREGAGKGEWEGRKGRERARKKRKEREGRRGTEKGGSGGKRRGEEEKEGKGKLIIPILVCFRRRWEGSSAVDSNSPHLYIHFHQQARRQRVLGVPDDLGNKFCNCEVPGKAICIGVRNMQDTPWLSGVTALPTHPRIWWGRGSLSLSKNSTPHSPCFRPRHWPQVFWFPNQSWLRAFWQGTF